MDNKISVKKAALINASGRYLKIVLSLLINAVLARILSPFDFGVVAVITVFSTFFATMSDMGFGAAVVQKKELTQRDIDSLFTYSVYVSIGLCLIFLFCAFPIALFYKNRIYLKPTALLSISLLFNSLDMIPNGCLNREKRFVTLAVRTLAAYLIPALVSIYLALHGWRFYALVMQAILSSAMQFVIDVSFVRLHFLRKPDFSAVRIVKDYSLYQFAFAVVNYFARNLDNLLTGRFFGEEKLGNYNKAYNLMLFPVNNLSGVISPVLHPIFSDYQNERSVIYNRYIKLVRLLFCTGIFIESFVFLASDEIIAILYGSQWASCAKCFHYLSIAIIPQMINASAGAVFQAIGNTRLLFLSTLINAVITVTAILIGIFIGNDIEFLSFCVAMSYLLHFVVAFYMLVCKGFGYRLTFFAKSIQPELVMTMIMIAVVLLWPFSIESIVISLLLKFSYILITFVPIVFFSKEYKLFLNK